MSEFETIALGFSGVSLVGLMAVARSYGKLENQVETLKECYHNLETKVDAAWEFQLRRGVVEGRMSEVLRQNSPITLEPKMLAALLPFTEDLRSFYESSHPNMTDSEEATALERLFGARMIKEICIPLVIFNGACLVAMMVYGRSLIEKTSGLSVLASGTHTCAVPAK